MEKNKKNKNYYQNNKKYYYKKKNEKEVKEKNTYQKLVNVRSDVSEISCDVIETHDNSVSIMKIVAVSIVVLAIIFGSLLLFHLL